MINTLLIIAQQTFMNLPLIIGAYISIALMKVPDLSIESAYTCGALCAGTALITLPGMPLITILILTLSASLLGGALVGTVSSSITQYGKLPHLLSSIVTFGIFHGLLQMFAGSYLSLSGLKNPLTLIAQFPKQPELVMLLIISGILLLIAAYLLKTQLGYSFAIYGNNPQFFSNYGISTRFVFMSGIIMSNALAGVSGYLCAQASGFAELNMGVGKVLMCITSLILGKTILQSKRPINIAAPLIGCLSYFALQQLMLKVGFNLTYFTMVQAVVVLIILISCYRKNQGQPIEHLGV